MAEAINNRVLAWARSKLRQKVGKGECWDLADQALRASGARSSTTWGDDDDYVWGKPIPINQVVPGDVLQLRDWIVTTKVETIVRLGDGAGYRDTDESVATRPHHTAIVERVGIGVVQAYEQHVKPLGKVVQLHEIPTRNAPPMVKEVQQMMKNSAGKMEMATVRTVTTVSVTGAMWAYRPQAK